MAKIKYTSCNIQYIKYKYGNIRGFSNEIEITTL